MGLVVKLCKTKKPVCKEGKCSRYNKVDTVVHTVCMENIYMLNTPVCDINCGKKKTRVRRARGGLYKYLRKNGNLSNPRPAPTFLSCEGAPASSRACALGHIPRVLPSPWSELIPLRRPRWDDRGPWTFPAFLYSPWTRSRQRERKGRECDA